MPSDDDVVRIKRRVQPSILGLDARVLGVGVGGKVDESGRPTGELAIWVITYADPRPGLPPIRSVIPRDYEGVKTHIVEVTKKVPEFQGKRVAAGSWIRGYRSAPGDEEWEVNTGTLGIAARTAEVPDDKRPNVLLSCHHVLGEQAGGRVVQLSCCNCCKPDVARVLRGDKRVDATIATINGDWEAEEGKIDDVMLTGTAYITPYPLWSSVPPDVLAALKNVAYDVYKYGAATGWTKGIVGCVDVACYPKFSPVTVPVILISSTGKDAKAFSKHGDSGSVVIDGKRRVVALLHGGQETLDEVGITWAVPIKDVERGLNIRVASTSPPSVWSAIATSPLSDTHRALAGTAFGRELLDMYGRHEPEVRRLLRESRQFVLAWHRCQGPELVGALTAVAERRIESLPTHVAGRSWADRVGMVLRALRGLGSVALVRDLDQIAPLLTGLGGRTYGQVLELIAGLESRS
ncbi:hypothetical protein [Streptomyces sp. I4(2020)]|uniref:hypothetical protein n=1 Tax=Streptomyces sp. I4(2020) TaxID=2760981 RepID=UPI0018EEB5D8|nr:hypothetical protein [Streptomyces sp. I4(2020)]MBJ6613909.1 hypothetical protein [Streptomyces sp. I3(2020)]MBJ6628734.1 hypothetical protein [Streptomyces sp. I4(2020)]